MQLTALLSRLTALQAAELRQYRKISQMGGGRLSLSAEENLRKASISKSMSAEQVCLLLSGNCEPVLLAGTTVSRATLHNQVADRKRHLCRRYGYNEKAGEIIPEVLSVKEHAENAIIWSFQVPLCPVLR